MNFTPEHEKAILSAAMRYVESCRRLRQIGGSSAESQDLFERYRFEKDNAEDLFLHSALFHRGQMFGGLGYNPLSRFIGETTPTPPMVTCPTCTHEFPRPSRVRLVIEEAAGYIEGDIIDVAHWHDNEGGLAETFGPVVVPGPAWTWSDRLIPLCAFGSEDCEWEPA